MQLLLAEIFFALMGHVKLKMKNIAESITFKLVLKYISIFWPLDLNIFPNLNSGLFNLNDPDVKVGKDLCVMARKLRSNLAQIRKLWIQQYFSFLISHDPLRQKITPANKSCIIP